MFRRWRGGRHVRCAWSRPRPRDICPRKRIPRHWLRSQKVGIKDLDTIELPPYFYNWASLSELKQVGIDCNPKQAKRKFSFGKQELITQTLSLLYDGHEISKKKHSTELKFEYSAGFVIDDMLFDRTDDTLLVKQIKNKAYKLFGNKDNIQQKLWAQLSD